MARRGDHRPMAAGLERYASFSDLSHEWEELADRAGASPFLRPGWFEAWWEAFGSGRLEVHGLRREGRLVAVLPLSRRRGLLSSLTNWHSPEFAVVAEDDAARRALLERLLGAGSAPVSLSFLSAGAPELATSRAMIKAAGGRVLERGLERSPYVPVDRDWEEYERSLDTRRRSEMRRRRRRLQELGAVTVEVEDGRRDLDRLLEDGFGVEHSGWKAEAGTAIASSKETRRFYTSVARWAADRGWLRLAFLRLDGRPLAFWLLIEAEEIAYQLKGGYDPEYRRFSPGVLLAHAMLRRAFSQGLRSYEFLGGDDAFKMTFARDVRERRVLQVFPVSVAGLTGWAAYAYGRPFVRRGRALVSR